MNRTTRSSTSNLVREDTPFRVLTANSDGGTLYNRRQRTFQSVGAVLEYDFSYILNFVFPPCSPLLLLPNATMLFKANILGEKANCWECFDGVLPSTTTEDENDYFSKLAPLVQSIFNLVKIQGARRGESHKDITPTCTLVSEPNKPLLSQGNNLSRPDFYLKLDAPNKRSKGKASWEDLALAGECKLSDGDDEIIDVCYFLLNSRIITYKDLLEYVQNHMELHLRIKK